jgi:hypothetical protein
MISWSKLNSYIANFYPTPEELVVIKEVFSSSNCSYGVARLMVVRSLELRSGAYRFTDGRSAKDPETLKHIEDARDFFGSIMDAHCADSTTDKIVCKA